MCEGLIQKGHLDIVKRLPGQATVEGFEDGPCAVATNTFEGRKSQYKLLTTMYTHLQYIFWTNMVEDTVRLLRSCQNELFCFVLFFPR